MLKTTKKDNVFIYYADHRNIGLVSFPFKKLYADDLNEALKNMY